MKDRLQHQQTRVGAVDSSCNNCATLQVAAPSANLAHAVGEVTTASLKAEHQAPFVRAKLSKLRNSSAVIRLPAQRVAMRTGAEEASDQGGHHLLHLTPLQLVTSISTKGKEYEYPQIQMDELKKTRVTAAKIVFLPPAAPVWWNAARWKGSPCVSSESEAKVCVALARLRRRFDGAQTCFCWQRASTHASIHPSPSSRPHKPRCQCNARVRQSRPAHRVRWLCYL